MPDSTPTAVSETPAVSQEQVPATPSPSTTPPPSPDGQEPDEETYDAARAMALIRKLRAEAKQATAAIKERDTLKAEQQAAADAKLSEMDRLSKRATQLEAEVAFERQERQDRINHYEVQLAAGRLGIVDPDAAVKLLNWDGLEFNQDGTPRDIDKALKILIRERPYLQGAALTPAMAATNGATRTNAPGARLYTKAELNDYAFYSTHQADIKLAMREGRIVD